jgi:hypothetical protein
MPSFLIFVKIQYKDDLAGGTTVPKTPEMERAKLNQRNISTVLYVMTLKPGVLPLFTLPFILQLPSPTAWSVTSAGQVIPEQLTATLIPII